MFSWSVARNGFLILLCTAGFEMVGRAGETDVVINEIMYHPPHSRDPLQYVELFNRGDAPVDLGGWAFIKGIQFTFPGKTKIASGAYLVVCRSLSSFTARYTNSIAALGDFSGNLSRHGERVELANAQGKVIDSVKYSDHSPWPVGPDGHGSSLERICARASSDAPDNWAASPFGSTPGRCGSPGRKNICNSSSLPPAIFGTGFTPHAPTPDQKVSVTASVADASGLKGVNLVYRVVTGGIASEESSVEMKRISGDDRSGAYEAVIPGQAQGNLVRFRIKAVATDGAERLQPAEYEPRATFSYGSFANTNRAAIPFAFVVQTGKKERPAAYRGRPGSSRSAAVISRPNGAFVYVPPDGGEVQIFDYVRIVPRKAGFKVHFLADNPFKSMTGVNILFEDSPRQVLSEPLSYELYHLAGVPASYSEHLRVWRDGHLLGYNELIEQPNKSFLARHWPDDSGNLYKILWYGHGVADQHEKKTNLSTGHDDIIQLINGLNVRNPDAQWKFIQENFNVPEVINYFAVNMCIQNWDGFFNNYFTYHVPGKDGKWEIIPWDEDKTWGDYDGASSRYDWYELPLTYAMNGDRAGSDFFSRFGAGPFGGAGWWRPPGFFSGPLLANPEFRKQFLSRLREICDTVFTEEKLLPVIAAMEKRLEGEIRVRAEAIGEDVPQSINTFRNDMKSFRNQLVNRRKFILAELKKSPP